MARPNVNGAASILLDYAEKVLDTDVLDQSELNPILLGLYGEVGGIMSTAKKHIREKAAYPGFKRAAEEEFGDALWYLTALCRRLKFALPEVFHEAGGGAATRFVNSSVNLSVDRELFELGLAAAALLSNTLSRTKVVTFAAAYVNALHAVGLSLSDVANSNVRKTRGAFIVPRSSELVDFDAEFGPEEQLPRAFKIRVNQRRTGKSYLQWNGVFIGDPLTDNVSDPDGYRFHDVFHFAHAAILHWSPVVRALIKHKRKSQAAYDETQDSGRAIVVEEGLTAWIFAQAKDLNFFEGQEQISLGMLKTIGEFVTGYEVSRCPLKLWERAILGGYDVFRKIRAAEGGWMVGDRTLRTIRYEPLEVKT